MKSNEQVRVLLVEDNVVNARFAEGLRAHVDDQVFPVHCADTLLAALDLLVRDTFTLLWSTSRCRILTGPKPSSPSSATLRNFLSLSSPAWTTKRWR